MSDFENSRDFGGNDNVGASPDTQETVLEGKVGMSNPQAVSTGSDLVPSENRVLRTNHSLHAEAMANIESTRDTEEPKKAKRVRGRREKRPGCMTALQHEGLQPDFRTKPPPCGG